jgi:hypothetical protein
MMYRPHDTFARAMLVVGLLAIANWALAVTGHGVMDVDTALVLISLYLAASTVTSLWRARLHLALVTSLSQVKPLSLLIVVLGEGNALLDGRAAGGMGHERTFFWSTVAAVYLVNILIRPQPRGRTR